MSIKSTPSGWYRELKQRRPIAAFSQNPPLVSHHHCLAALQTYLVESVKPIANKMDYDAPLLKQALDELAKQGWLGATIPQSLGGLELSKTDYHLFKKMLARYSGALTFLQTQHQTSAQLIQSSNNSSLKLAYLPKMANGEHLVGMALSPHLAYWQNPSVMAIKQEGGFLIPKAVIRMATGYDFFHELLIGFVVKEENKPAYEVTAFVPFKTTSQPSSNGSIRYSTPLELLAVQATNSVSVEIDHWFIADESVVKQEPLGSFAKKSLTKTNLDSYLAGVIAALLDIMALAVSSSHTPTSLKGYAAFQRQLTAYEEMILAKEKRTPVAEIRAVGIELCDACFAFLKQLLRGKIMMKNDSVSQQLHRLERERDLYSVVTAYQDLLEATLEQQLKMHAVLSSESTNQQNINPSFLRII